MDLKDKLRSARAPKFHERLERTKKIFQPNRDIAGVEREKVDALDRRLLMEHLAELAETGPEEFRDEFREAAEALFALTGLLLRAESLITSFSETTSKANYLHLKASGEVGGLKGENVRLKLNLEDVDVQLEALGVKEQVVAGVKAAREARLRAKQEESIAKVREARGVK